MPSNADLIKSIAELSEALGKDAPDTEGKSNAELANIASALKAEKKKADEDTTPGAAANAAADAKKDAAAEKEKAAAKKPKHSVAERKAVTSKRGILSDGDEIKAEYLPGGEDTLKALIKSGHVVKN